MIKPMIYLIGATSTVGIIFPSPALAQIAAPTPTPAPANPGAFLDITSTRGFIVLLILIGIVVLVWFVPFMLDLKWSHDSQLAAVAGKRRSSRRSNAANVSDTNAAANILYTGDASKFSRRHLIRALIAFTVVTVLGVALVLVMSGNTSDAVDLRKTLVGAFVAIVSTVIGFYFGGRTAESAAAGAAAQPAGAVTLTPTTADFTEEPEHLQNTFTISNTSSVPVTVLSAEVTDQNLGFQVDTRNVPAGWWNGNTTIIPASGTLSLRVTWAPDDAPGSGPFETTLIISHNGTGAAQAQLKGTKGAGEPGQTAEPEKGAGEPGQTAEPEKGAGEPGEHGNQ